MIGFFPPMIETDVISVMLELSKARLLTDQIMSCCRKNRPLLCNLTEHKMVEHGGLITFMSLRDYDLWAGRIHSTALSDGVYFSQMKEIPSSLGKIFNDLFLRGILERAFLNQDPIASFQSEFIVLVAGANNPLIISLLSRDTIVVSDGFSSGDVFSQHQFFVVNIEDKTSFSFNAKDEDGNQTFERD